MTGDILTDEALLLVNQETHASLEFQAEMYTKLFEIIASFKTEEDILTDEALLQVNQKTQASLEFQAEMYTKLFETIASLKAERDEWQRRYQDMVDIYQTGKYDEEPDTKQISATVESVEDD